MKTTKTRLKEIIREEVSLLNEKRGYKYIRAEPPMAWKEVYRILKRLGHDLKRPPVWYKQKSKAFPNGIPQGHPLRKEFRAWKGARFCRDEKNTGKMNPWTKEICPEIPYEDQGPPYEEPPEDPQSWDPEYHHIESEPVEKEYGPFKIPKNISNHLYKQIEYAIGVVEYGDTASIGAEARALASGVVDIGTFFANVTIGQIPIVAKLFADAVRMSCDVEEGTCNIEILKRKAEELNIKMRDPKFVPDIQQRNMKKPYFSLPDWMHVNLDQDAPAIPSSGAARGWLGGRAIHGGSLGDRGQYEDAVARYGGDIEHPKASPDHPLWVRRKAFEWTRDALEKFAKERASYPPKTKPERISREITDEYKFTPEQARRDGETMLRKALDHASGRETRAIGTSLGHRPSPRPRPWQVEMGDEGGYPGGEQGGWKDPLAKRPREYDFLRGNGYKIYNLAVKEEMYDEARELARQLLVDREHLIPWDQISFDLLKVIEPDYEKVKEVIDAQVRKNTEKRRARRSPLQQQRAERANRRYRDLNKLDENKITKLQLKQIIKEELHNVLSESSVGRRQARVDRGSGAYSGGKGTGYGTEYYSDQERGAALARSTDTHLNPTIDTDRDRIDHEYKFGPDDPELIEFAKELALRAGAEDRVTYDWREFMDEAKKDLMLLGVDR